MTAPRRHAGGGNASFPPPPRQPSSSSPPPANQRQAQSESHKRLVLEALILRASDRWHDAMRIASPPVHPFAQPAGVCRVWLLRLRCRAGHHRLRHHRCRHHRHRRPPPSHCRPCTATLQVSAAHDPPPGPLHSFCASAVLPFSGMLTGRGAAEGSARMQWYAWSDSRVESVQVLQVRQQLEEALAVVVHFGDRTVEEVEVAQVGQRALRMARQARQQRIGGQGAPALAATLVAATGTTAGASAGQRRRAPAGRGHRARQTCCRRG